MQVRVCDVGPRDGLQNEPDVLAPAVRAELVRRLAAAGLPRIEAVSFVRGDRVPQMDGAEEVLGAVGEVAAELSGLVLNERGWEGLAATALDRVNCTLAATESFNRRNGNASLEEATARVEAILARADRPATVTISCAFGCPFEGEVDPGVVAALAERLAAAGADEVVLADTIGVAVPRQVRSLVERVGAGGATSGPLPRHAAHRRRLRVGGARGRRDRARRVGRRARRLPVRAAGDRERGDRGSRLPPRPRGRRTGVDLEALIGVAEWVAGVLGARCPAASTARGPFPVTPAATSAATSASE